MKRRLFVLLLLLTGIAQAISPWERYSITEAVGKGTWETSEEIFRKLRESDLPPGQVSQVDYNLGVALYSQEKYEESLPLFETAAKTESEALKAKALYNQGNALFKLDRLDEAKAAFQQSLLINPDDDDTRHNIEVILEKQEQEQNQQDQDQQDQQDQENESESDQDKQDDKGESDEQEQDQNNEDEQNEDSKSEQQDGESEQDQQSGQDKQDQQGQQQEMTEAEKKAAQEAAERARLLDYFKQQERDGRPAQRVRAQAPPVRGKTW